MDQKRRRKMRLNKSRIFGGLAWVVLASLGVPAGAAPTPKPGSKNEALRKVRTVYHRNKVGNAYFNSQLRAELTRGGLRFVNSQRSADAILDSQGQYRGRAFRGEMKFYDQSSHLIWQQKVMRPGQSNSMAYQQLADKWRAERGRAPR
jgi:hypothetical protein